MSTRVPQNSELIKNLFDLLEAHRPAFGQERVFLRVVGLVFGELWAFGSHTITKLLLALGLHEEDWTSWYRLFSRERFKEEETAHILFDQTLVHVSEDALYVVGGDGTQIPRDSRKMEGSSWLKCPRNPPFKYGIHRAQRFMHGSWLVPAENGYSRAIPLRMLPAFPPKAVRTLHEATTEGSAGIQFMAWVRERLNQAGRNQQQILGLFDGSYDNLDWWKTLPDGVITLVRSAKNRHLRELYTGDDGRRKYGEKAPTPAEWLKVKAGWKKKTLLIRNRKRKMVYRVEGPFIRYGAPNTPLFLIVVKGQQYNKGKRRKYRKPAYYLVNAIQNADGEWVLPLPVETLLFWAWQRWELEVTHREMKTGFGVGDKQCWNSRSAVSSVQWSAWVYALFVLAGYRTWGLSGAPPASAAWWPGAKRWSLDRLWQQYRLELWRDEKYHPLWPASPTNWGDKEVFFSDLVFATH